MSIAQRIATGWRWAASMARVARGSRWPVRRGEPFDPIFIVGAPRSGNTLLRRIIQATPGIHIPPELPVLPKVVLAYQKYNFLPWPMLVDATLGGLQAFRRFEYFDMPLRPLATRLRQIPEESRSLAGIIDAFYRFHAEHTAQPCVRWGDKTPLSYLNNHSLEHIVRVFPSARLVHILRDGVDVVRSILTDLSHGGYDLASAAREWSRAVAAVRAFQSRHPQSIFELRYEQLVSDPLPIAEKLYGFLGLPFDRAVVEKSDHTARMGDVTADPWHAPVQGPIFSTSIGKGRREFSAQEKRILQDSFRGSLEREGYPAATAA